jgi:transglutaminase-like putative cysteine protease
MHLCDVKIGLCRHKALLFKLLCDVVGLNCALVTGYSTAGRHQWNIITLDEGGDFLIDPTSPHFTWTQRGSQRTKGYRVTVDTSFGHSGLTQKENGLL